MDVVPWTELCLVCGHWEDGEEFHHPTGDPLYVICERCGCESGIDDYRPAELIRSRERWLTSDRARRFPRDQLDADISRVPRRFVQRKPFWRK